MHGQGKNSSFFQYSYYLPAKLQRNNDTTKYYRLFFIVPLPLAPCPMLLAPFSLPLGGDRGGALAPRSLPHAPCSLPLASCPSLLPSSPL